MKAVHLLSDEVGGQDPESPLWVESNARKLGPYIKPDGYD